MSPSMIAVAAYGKLQSETLEDKYSAEMAAELANRVYERMRAVNDAGEHLLGIPDIWQQCNDLGLIVWYDKETKALVMRRSDTRFDTKYVVSDAVSLYNALLNLGLHDLVAEYDCPSGRREHTQNKWTYDKEHKRWVVDQVTVIVP